MKNRKSISIILVIAVILSTLNCVLFVNAENSPTFEISSANGNAGDTVTVTISTKNNPGITSFKGNVYYDESILTLTDVSYNKDWGGNSVKPQSKASPFILNWIDALAEENCTINDVFATLTFKINDGATPGASSTISMTYDENDVYNALEENVSFKVSNGKVTVNGQEETNAYKASVSSVKSAYVGENITTTISVSKKGATKYAAAEAILQYDSSKLQYVSSNVGAVNTNSVTPGIIKLSDYGASKDLGEAFIVTFKALEKGSTDITLSSASFSDKESASTKDLESAQLDVSKSTVSIKKSYSVTLPEIFEGNTSVDSDSTYTFTAKDTSNYNYELPTATMGGSNIAVVDNKDGTYCISDVTGDLVISGNRSAKEYAVNFITDNNVSLPQNGTATYGKNYTFTIPSESHYSVNITSIKMGETYYTNYSILDGVVTIPGGDITGVITVKIDKTLADIVVSKEGTGSGDISEFNGYANTTDDYSFSINKDSLYNYSVSAKIKGKNDITVTDNGNGTYSISKESYKLGDEVVINVSKTMKVDGISVKEFVKVGNSLSVWLIKNNTSKLSDKAFTIDGNTMFWSNEYSAYCYLVISDIEPIVNHDNLSISNDSVISIDYNGDVNKSGKIDTNDAQFIYNIYNADYSQFNAEITVEKILRADVNHDGVINVNDATAVVNKVL